MIDTKKKIQETNEYIQAFIDDAKEDGYTKGLQQLHDARQRSTLSAKLLKARLYWASAPEEMKDKAKQLAYLIHWDMEEIRKERFEYKMNLMRKLIEIENEIKEIQQNL